MSYKEGGLKPTKYIIQKTSGRPVDPHACYFVLRYDTDPHARSALVEYARSVSRVNTKLAQDLVKALDESTDAFIRNHQRGE